jgi:spore maturation protein CgeB
MKILLVGGREGISGHIAGWIDDALTVLKVEHRFFDYRKRRLPIVSRFRSYSERARSIDQIAMNRDLLKTVSEYNPDAVVVLFGESIFIETLEAIRADGKTILANWFHDTILSQYRNDFLEKYPKHYDCFFIIDSLKALERVDLKCRNVYTLPCACDENVHKKIYLNSADEKEYKSDACFVGVVNQARGNILSELVRDSGLDLAIWAPRNSYYGDFYKYAPALSKYSRRGPIPYEDAVIAMNAAKIVLNIHAFTGEEHFDLPSRIFDTAGCGAFQLVEYTDTLEKYFEIGKEIICYSGAEDLKKLVKYYLEHDDERKAIAARAQARAYRDHTYANRVRTLVEALQKRKDR